MGVLTEIPDNKIITPKGKIIVNPAFDYVLEIQKLYREEELGKYEKMDQALRMLVKNNWNLRLFSIEEKILLFEDICKKYIETKKRPKMKQAPVPILDFEEDGDYIYASFMQDYHIDLIDMQGRLPWKKFLYLFNGLSDKTKIKQVMQIRSMDVPEYNGHNMKQIQNIQELKSYYALPIRGGGGQSGLDLLFSTLEGMAKR